LNKFPGNSLAVVRGIWRAGNYDGARSDEATGELGGCPVNSNRMCQIGAPVDMNQ
jgi:hypothetical protein